MEDVSSSAAHKTCSASPLEPAVAAKAAAADAVGSGEEAGQSTVCCSSEDEFQNSGLCLSEDDREDSGAHVPRSPAPHLEQYAATGAEQQNHLSHHLEPHSAAYTYTVSGLENVTLDQPPTSWLKPRIKIDGPEVFHGLLRANDDNLPATETIPSTETFVSFQGQWRVVTSTGTSSYIGQTMNPWDPSTATYPLPITYKVSEDEVVIREPTRATDRASARLGLYERARRFFCTSIAEYMQS